MGDLKILAVEARNHLYAILKDTEIWQEALQGKCPLIVDNGRSDQYHEAWKQSNVTKDSGESKQNRATLGLKGNPTAVP